MAFTGVNRANVAVTDTFDTWRIRTNEVNTTLNLAAAANTADTLVYRDNLGSANLNVLNANTTVVTHTGTVDSAISVVSAVAAHSGGSYASILTTGGIYGTLSSKFAADLTIGTNLTVDGTSALGNATTDTLTVLATLSSNIIPTTTSTIGSGAAVGSMLGAAANSFAHIYTTQETISAAAGVTTNVFSVTSAAGAGNTATFLNNGATTGTVLAVTSSSTDAGARNLVHINQSGAAGASGSAGVSGLRVTAASGRGIFIDAPDADGEEAFQIDSGQTTSNAISIDAATTTGTGLDMVASGVLVGAGKAVEIRSSTVTTGTLLYVNSAATNTSTRNLVQITNDAAAATGTTTLGIQADAGRGIFVNSTLAAGGYSFEVDGAHTTTNTAKIDSAATSGTMLELTASGTLTGKGVNLTADSATTGTGLFMSMDALTTGKMIDLTSTATLVTTGRIIDITADSATTANGISVSMDALTTGGILDISSSSTSTTGRSLATISQTGDVTTSGDTTGLKLAMTSGRGLFIDSDDVDGTYAFEIDAEQAGSNTAKVDSAATTGTILQVVGSAVLAGTGKGVDITADSATTGTGLYMSMDGLTTGKMVDLTSTGTIAGAGRVLDITADSLTTGIGVNMSVDALTTGSALFINSSSTHSGNLVSFVSDGAATGPTLYMRSDASTSTVKVLQVANSTADIFSVTQAGDATIGNDLTIAGDFVVTGNLSVAGATTELNTATTLIRDKTLVLGVKDGGSIACTFDSHASAPTFTTVGAVAHGLSASSVIFISVTGSADNGVTSEALYTVATAANSTIFTLSGTIDTQSGTRTLQFSGPQTDALIDDAGIYLPGSTEIHSFKWDNTDNYWETSDSLFINDTGQLVLPKGTDAQRPASSATATVPAATTGAIRYNSDTSKVEAVITSTTYENMSTETFATAIAIALG
jgi:hypothetical protein